MKYFKILFLFTVLLSCKISADGMLHCPLKWPSKDQFENYWVKGEEIGNQNERIIDWFPKGSKVHDTDETFTIQTYQFEESFDLSLIKNKFISTLEENIEPKELLHYKIFEETKNEIALEWWVNAPHPSAEHEWIKFMKNPSHQLAIVRYVTKNEIQPKEESHWIQCVLEAVFEGENP